MATGKEFGLSLVVDVSKQVIGYQTAIIVGVGASLVVKHTANQWLAGTSLVLAGLGILFASIFLMQVAHANIYQKEPNSRKVESMIFAAWSMFLLAIAAGTAYLFSYTPG